MTGQVQYRPNRRGMAELMVSDEVRDIVQDAADEGEDWLRSAAPVDSGEYRDSFFTEQMDLRMYGTRRACVAIHNSAPYATEVDERYMLFPQVVNVIESIW